MIKITGIDGGLLTIGEFDILDETLSVIVEKLVVIEGGAYPVIQPRRILNTTNLRFRGEIFYESNKLQDHLMLPAHLKPECNYGVYSIALNKENTDTAYLLVNYTHGIGVLSNSFYQLCRYCQDFDQFKINGALLVQSKVYAAQAPRLNLSSDLLGDEFEKTQFPHGPMHDFNWGDDFTPSVIAYVEKLETAPIPFGYEHTGTLIGIGDFQTWYVTASTEIPNNHINNIRNFVIDLKVSQISAQKFLTNTVTTPEYLKLLIDQHNAFKYKKIHITSETRTGLPIYIVYNIETDSIDECFITYSPGVLQDYINAKHLQFTAVNTEEKIEVEAPVFEKDDRYQHANVSLTSIMADTNNKPQGQPTNHKDDDSYTPDIDVLAIQKANQTVDRE